jgi:hypothetical protein
MTHYLLSVYQPDGPIPEPEALAAIGRDLQTVNDDIRAAGAWVFSNGLLPASAATVLRPSGSEVLITDGPYSEGKEHLGGFTIVEASDLDAALEWGRRVAIASTLPVEVRPFAG